MKKMTRLLALLLVLVLLFSALPLAALADSKGSEDAAAAAAEEREELERRRRKQMEEAAAAAAAAAAARERQVAANAAEREQQMAAVAVEREKQIAAVNQAAAERAAIAEAAAEARQMAAVARKAAIEKAEIEKACELLARLRGFKCAKFCCCGRPWCFWCCRWSRCWDTTIEYYDPATVAENLLGDGYANAVGKDPAKLTNKAFTEYVFRQGGKVLDLEGDTLEKLIAANGTEQEKAVRGSLILLLDGAGKPNGFGIALSKDNFAYFNDVTGKVEKSPLKDQNYSAVKVK
ncbi:MAG: hypothetical protein K6F56_00040 [Oscillospiraceae bacterium]|nr:hypothetical protein [Oscillospiraceae bacterium]